MRIRKQLWSPAQEWLPLHMPHLWDLDRADDIHAVEGYAPSVSPDRRTLALIEPGGRITLRDADTCQVLHTLRESGPWPGSVAFSPDGNLLAVSASATVQLWDPD